MVLPVLSVKDDGTQWSDTCELVAGDEHSGLLQRAFGLYADDTQMVLYSAATIAELDAESAGGRRHKKTRLDAHVTTDGETWKKREGIVPGDIFFMEAPRPTRSGRLVAGARLNGWLVALHWKKDDPAGPPDVVPLRVGGILGKRHARDAKPADDDGGPAVLSIGPSSTSLDRTPERLDGTASSPAMIRRRCWSVRHGRSQSYATAMSRASMPVRRSASWWRWALSRQSGHPSGSNSVSICRRAESRYAGSPVISRASAARRIR
jgi:hypothetical protein